MLAREDNERLTRVALERVRLLGENFVAFRAYPMGQAWKAIDAFNPPAAAAAAA